MIRKNKVEIRMALFIYLFFFIINLNAISSKEKANLSNFLYSENIHQKIKAFNLIIGDKNKYKNLILDELQKYVEKTDSLPDELIYIAAYIRDKRFIQPLIKLLENLEYSNDQCIYSCPIVFALTIYACFSPYSLPTALNTGLVPVHNLMSEIEGVRKLTLKSEKASSYIKGPGIDSDLKKAESMTTEQLIFLASPNNDGSISRLAAAFVLSHRINNEENIPDLYWLAISEELDASMEYRFAIYWAIYKVETAKLRKGKK